VCVVRSLKNISEKYLYAGSHLTEFKRTVWFLFDSDDEWITWHLGIMLFGMVLGKKQSLICYVIWGFHNGEY
jgi:hypothetical protein